MQGGLKIATFTVLILVLISCDRNGNHGDVIMQNKFSFSLCPKRGSSRDQLYDIVINFAKQENARVVDRGTEAQAELSGVHKGKDVLSSTGGDLMLLTIEKPNEFRISLTNLELNEKFALTVKYFGRSEGGNRVESLLDDIERSWDVRGVEGGITNDPPCSSST